MQRILLFLYSLRAFLLFVLLEAVAIWLIVSFNSQQGSAFFNSSNKFSGKVLTAQKNVSEYFSLADVNARLLDTNAELLTELEILRKPADSAYVFVDSVLAANFEFKGAKVINNSIRLSQNHLTINKGSKHGIKPGMGVFNGEGVVGRVKGVSTNFATVISLLHTELLISSKVDSSEVFGSIKWDGVSPRYAKMLYVPRHVKVAEGDNIVTSGYNAIFPEGIKVGVISEVKQGSDTNYLDIIVELATDFTKISYVYLVENTVEAELDSLYKSSGISNE
ncbi:rod shape-determining protein MreC [Belliella kenyensis]|uniref:Cell shape-determining protein MreC n=1 Tax=Belliella kenyensis TaxID=1472724 RepID=A0ABV8EGW2_9BACT|nr:rod shape-determining protein MreC [Belliella kenyensis]MCH7402322.1 rod shape-determining protein MreC [Belliella kenyensis]MDN3603513.1 rod shape-determining protein MreC [Belliella kenyensis]